MHYCDNAVKVPVNSLCESAHTPYFEGVMFAHAFQGVFPRVCACVPYFCVHVIMYDLKEADAQERADALD